MTLLSVPGCTDGHHVWWSEWIPSLRWRLPRSRAPVDLGRVIWATLQSEKEVCIVCLHMREDLRLRESIVRWCGGGECGFKQCVIVTAGNDGALMAKPLHAGHCTSGSIWLAAREELALAGEQGGSVTHTAVLCTACCIRPPRMLPMPAAHRACPTAHI